MMYMRNMLALAAAATSGLLAARLRSDMPASQAYQTVKPITEKNIGRSYVKYGCGKYLPHQGEREMARRRRQLAAGQIYFIKHGSSSRTLAADGVAG